MPESPSQSEATRTEPARRELPRPPAPDPRTAAFTDRLHRLRGEPWVGAVLLAIVAVAAGAFWFRSEISAPSGAATAPSTTRTSAHASPPLASTTTSSTSATPARLFVHVAGAVVEPGVVTLDAGARVIDAIDAAGGATADADLDRLNLAAPLVDGERVAVAHRGQPAPPLDPGATSAPSAGVDPSAGNAAGSGSSNAGEPTPGNPVNLNTATQGELEALPGIGPSLAQAIIAERERSGGFTSVDDLKRVRGIGDVRFAELKDLVTV